jgi:predicted nucleic acid-binding protein
MTGPDQYLLDTNILMAYIRAGPLGEYVEKRYSLKTMPFKPLVCVVSIGELKAIAVSSAWGPARLKQMDGILQRVVKVEIGQPEVLDAYAVAVNSRPKGLVIPQNDLWIAAATIASRACLLTSDRHFDYLADQKKIVREFIDTAIGKPK